LLKYGEFLGEMRLFLMWAPNNLKTEWFCACDTKGKFAGSLARSFTNCAKQKECQILEGHLMPDHAHMRIAIPPKQFVASVIGFINGKSAITIARMRGKERNFAGEHFWARGYAVWTAGFNEEEVRRYIRNKNGSDESDRR
jgi:REP-associated tyrosine transposase